MQLFSGPFEATPKGFVRPRAINYCATGNQASVMTTALILFIPSFLQALQRFSPSRIRNESCSKQMWIGSWSPRFFIARPISSMHSAAQTIRRFGLIFLTSISRMSSPIDFPLWLVKTCRTIRNFKANYYKNQEARCSMPDVGWWRWFYLNFVEFCLDIGLR